MTNAFYQAIHVAATLSIADLLKDKPRSADDLAEATGTHAPTLYRLLCTLASVGVFAEQVFLILKPGAVSTLAGSLSDAETSVKSSSPFRLGGYAVGRRKENPVWTNASGIGRPKLREKPRLRGNWKPSGKRVLEAVVRGSVPQGAGVLWRIRRSIACRASSRTWRGG